ncbi:adenylate/guanylate cyclase domain-containing protein [Rhizobium leguminosarum]|uniref:adenylate/guanylate cyclase domain-containing protein n=1 Tax=Rhizobium leguminosarum TaxID=384 RepID=UPI00161BE0A0|nr:adenylate/guanylate cyclase domain-containing protein [Rhizobium leguminosarum]MBB4345556.1 adenylate cyclase [Rhizobium leguminosarum]MBB6298628.1 adenylate cyclase [Rhizobium leguminosarum]
MGWLFKTIANRSHASRSAPTSDSVDKLFRESEIEAEYAIGWVRIAVGLALLASGLVVWSGTAELTDEYSLSQVRFTAQFTVGTFLALGIVSLLLVIRRWFRPWMAFVLVTGDAAILGYSLFLGLEGLGLGGNWIAAIPTIWLVPLGLAVGALRYRPLVQVWATIVTMIALVGVVCALGFRSFLNGFGIAEVPSDLEANIGRLSSLPAYLMRAVMLMLIGLTTALAMLRSRRLLMRAVNETTRRANLARFLPAEIAPLAGESDISTWRQGRRQQAAILFVDIRGFTAYAEGVDPARLSIFISSFRRRVTHAAEAFGGVVDKFIGDGALLVFGVPDPQSDDCTRAIACAQELLELMDQWNAKRGFDPPIRVGIGIHTGEVYCGLVGDDKRIEFTVLGDVVNVAAKIEQATKRFNTALLASETVVMRSGQLRTWREVGREPLAGRGEHLAIFACSGTKLRD